MQFAFIILRGENVFPTRDSESLLQPRSRVKGAVLLALALEVLLSSQFGSAPKEVESFLKETTFAAETR